MSLRHWSSFTLALAASSVSSLALATPTFPATIRNHLDLAYQPPCTLCHATVGGGGPVVTAMGRSLLARGMVANNDASLRAALDRLVTERVDSDGDGTIDIDELLVASDPNTAQVSNLADVPPLEHGCVGQIAPRGRLGAPAFAGVLAALLLLARRKERRERPTASGQSCLPDPRGAVAPDPERKIE